ncbi:hypothetical protein FB567DRAFT_542042 [Paraphoma chrysanthemicola]|uniref:Exosome complex protein n=1 Tax=Paraphoma chrysanthemicola TaxID=798071 RepID=A0A8K0QSR0_9PLEO|nr:hypothetical protein FB567DRAFT_542042 [Paraphoma chrysanthemicola]
MDPQTDLPDLVEDLEVNIDELSETLSPLLNKSLSTNASSLPLLDKAKLYVLAAYSVESLLYSSLQASGVNAKEHAIFKELARLKGYFAKIKQAEERMTTPAAPKAKLDVGAAARFIRHGLAGNDKYDLKRAERMAKEKARAQLKARQINKKFDDNDDPKAATITPQKRPVEDIEATQPEQDDDAILEGLQDPAASPAASEPDAKKPRVAEPEAMDIDSTTSPAPCTSKKSNKKQPFKKKNEKKKSAKAAARAEAGLDLVDNQDDTSNPSTPSQALPTKRATRSRKAKSAADETEDPVEGEAGLDSPPSGRAPKTRSETGKGVVDGEGAGEKAKRGRGKGKKAK